MNTIQILMLEDNPMDVKIIQKLITKNGLQVNFTVVASGLEYTSKLEQFSYDIILSDHQLPDFDSIRALEVRNQKHEAVPFILITGAVSEEIALALIKQGADDYILKDRLQRLPTAIEDAIQKRKTEKAKQSMETSLSILTERLQLAAKTSYDIIWDYDLDSNFIYCSDAIEKVIGIPGKDRFRPAELMKYVYSEDVASLENSFAIMVLGKEQRWRKIFRAVRNDGNLAWINNNAIVIRDKKEKPVRIVGVMHDVTEIRRLQHELMEQETQSQKQMAAITIQAQEKERSEIGKELHDNVNQLLATAKIMIDTARTTPDLHDICLAKSQESIMDAINELRNIAHSMMTPSFDDFKFEQIIQDITINYNLSGKFRLRVAFPPSELLDSIPNAIKLAFYRIIQEQVSNILKYARAKNVMIKLFILENSYTLEISDDGIGFDTSRKTKGIGLRNMESRVVVFGGSMNITSAPGKGCKIELMIPSRFPVFTQTEGR